MRLGIGGFMVRGNRGRGAGSFSGRGRPPLGRGGGSLDDDAASTDGDDAADSKRKKAWRRKKPKGTGCFTSAEV